MKKIGLYLLLLTTFGVAFSQRHKSKTHAKTKKAAKATKAKKIRTSNTTKNKSVTVYVDGDGNFITATPTGKLPALLFSDGTDRLGGAKMNYIDSNVSMQIIDSAKDLYHVKLSKYHTAYIEKALAKLGTGFETRTALSESWKIFGDSAFDYVQINLSKRVAYKTWMDVHPSKIMLEIYGAMANTNWIGQLSTAKEVKNVFYEQPEDDVIRVTIELKHPQPWGYGVSYEGEKLQVKIRQQPTNLILKNLTIAIDAGHGGTNLGTDDGIDKNILEKNFTLLFAQELQKILIDKNVNVIMTREIDSTIDNKDRTLKLQSQWPDLLVSFHLNSSANPATQGVSTYYKHVAYRPLTQALLKRILEIDGMKEYGNIGSFNFQLIQPTEYNSSLVEIAFLSNREDEKRILDQKFRQKIAEQVEKGIEDWLKEVSKQ